MDDPTENPDGPHLRVKVEIWHDRRYQNRDVKKIETRLETILNHPDERVTDVEIAVGNEAGAVFLDLIPKRWKGERLERLASDVAWQLENESYADNITAKWWHIEPVSESSPQPDTRESMLSDAPECKHCDGTGTATVSPDSDAVQSDVKIHVEQDCTGCGGTGIPMGWFVGRDVSPEDVQ